MKYQIAGSFTMSSKKYLLYSTKNRILSKLISKHIIEKIYPSLFIYNRVVNDSCNLGLINGYIKYKKKMKEPIVVYGELK